MKSPFWIALLAGLLLGTASRANAAEIPAGRLSEFMRGQFPRLWQRDDSQRQDAPRRQYADVPFQGNLELSLKQRLEQIRDLSELFEELKKHPELFDPKKLEKGDWKNPEFLQKHGPKLLDMFKGMGLVDKEGEGLKLNEDKLKGLKEDLQKQIEKMKGAGAPDQLPNPNPEVPDGNPPPPPFQGKLPPLPDGKLPEAPGWDGDEEGRMADFFKDWMLKMEESKFGDLFRNSPAFQDGLKELVDSVRKGEGEMWQPGAGFADNFAKWSNPGDLGWFKNTFTMFDKLSLPNLRPPGFSPPKFGGWAPNVPAPGPWAAGPAIGGSGFGMVVLWVGVGVVILVLLWKLLPHLRVAAQERTQAGWRLGPWPVDPHRVATRAEVVKAFEFLSLLRFGLDVRTWNHRDIAQALGSAAGDRPAAQELAQVYELARYTPDDERLPEASLAAARRDLCFLAGMS
jgi:hypothetical protein